MKAKRTTRSGGNQRKLRYLWCNHGIRLALEGKARNATNRNVLIYACEIW